MSPMVEKWHQMVTRFFHSLGRVMQEEAVLPWLLGSNITIEIMSNTDLTVLTMETLVCRLKLNNHPIDFQVIYRIPSTSILKFCS